MGSEQWVGRDYNTALLDTHRIAGKGKDETGTMSQNLGVEMTAYVTIFLSEE